MAGADIFQTAGVDGEQIRGHAGGKAAYIFAGEQISPAGGRVVQERAGFRHRV